MKDMITPLGEKSIILNGFMGVGKTTVGKILADQLNRPFIDMDDQIEADHQMTIPEIFQRFGEKAFRQIEKETTVRNVAQRDKVIALGGGAFMQEEIRSACLENGFVIHLDISWHLWKERMGMLVDTRPVLQHKTMDEIEALFYERRKVYAQNHAALLTDNHTENEVADKIINLL